MPYLPGIGRVCKKCGRPLPPTLRGDRKYCSEECRKEQNKKQSREAYDPHPLPDLPYKVLPVREGWLVFYVEEGKPPRPVDGRVKPYTQKTHAYRAARRLNKASKQVDQMIAEKGAIII